MAIVIDNGSGFMKVGIAQDETPKYVFPTVVADVESSNALVGEAALAKGEDSVVRPLRAGEVRDAAAMEKVWQYAIDEVGGQDKPVLLTEPILNDAANREKMCQIMFEKLNVPAVYLAAQPVLALYATGRKTGVVLDVGESLTQCAPIFDGYAVTEGLFKSQLAGGKITGYLRDRLRLSDNQTARDIKETLCYLVADPEAELKKDASALEASYTLPDGKTIQVGAERVKAPEMMFNSASEAAGFKANSGLAKMLQDSVQKCEMDVRRDIAKNVVLAGGSTLFKGIDDRLNAATPDNYKVVGAKNLKYTTWIGGSILASLDNAAGYLSKKEFEEGGLSAIQKKFP